MAYQVTTNVPSVEIGGQFIQASGTTVTIDDATYNALSPSAFSGGSPTLTLVAQVPNPGDSVSIQGTHVAAPAALTAPADLGASYSQTNVNALRADVAALQTKLTAVMAALTGTNKPMA